MDTYGVLSALLPARAIAAFGQQVMRYGFKNAKSIIPITGLRGEENRAAIMRALRDTLKQEPYVSRNAVAKSLADAINDIDTGHFPLSSGDAAGLITEAVRDAGVINAATVGDTRKRAFIYATTIGDALKRAFIYATTIGDALKRAYGLPPRSECMVLGRQPTTVIYYEHAKSLVKRVREEFSYIPTFRAKSADK